MGLGAAKVKQRFGLDPRNTAWSNDTSKFGHQMLEKFGWKPGMGLGMMPHDSASTHIRVSIKDDNLGLGAKTRRQGAKDELDSDGCAGLDVFQRLLGRLNGKEEQVSQELERQRVDRVINGKWGVHFVKGEVLSSTWDPETRTLRQYSNTESNKRPAQENEEEGRRHKKEKKDKRKEKRAKKEKKEKRKEKKAKKEKKGTSEQDKKHKHKHVKDELKDASPAPETSRLSARSRWIKQKRAATMDPVALNEIFMITDSK